MTTRRLAFWAVVPQLTITLLFEFVLVMRVGWKPAMVWIVNDPGNHLPHLFLLPVATLGLVCLVPFLVNRYRESEQAVVRLMKVGLPILGLLLVIVGAVVVGREVLHERAASGSADENQFTPIYKLPLSEQDLMALLSRDAELRNVRLPNADVGRSWRDSFYVDSVIPFIQRINDVASQHVGLLTAGTAAFVLNVILQVIAMSIILTVCLVVLFLVLTRSSGRPIPSAAFRRLSVVFMVLSCYFPLRLISEYYQYYGSIRHILGVTMPIVLAVLFFIFGAVLLILKFERSLEWLNAGLSILISLAFLVFKETWVPYGARIFAVTPWYVLIGMGLFLTALAVAFIVDVRSLARPSASGH